MQSIVELQSMKLETRLIAALPAAGWRNHWFTLTLTELVPDRQNEDSSGRSDSKHGRKKLAKIYFDLVRWRDRWQNELWHRKHVYLPDSKAVVKSSEIDKRPPAQCCPWLCLPRFDRTRTSTLAGWSTHTEKTPHLVLYKLQQTKNSDPKSSPLTWCWKRGKICSFLRFPGSDCTRTSALAVSIFHIEENLKLVLYKLQNRKCEQNSSLQVRVPRTLKNRLKNNVCSTRYDIGCFLKFVWSSFKVRLKFVYFWFWSL